jgi:hypothetical protein
LYRVNLIAASYPFPQPCGGIIARERGARKNKIGFTLSATSNLMRLNEVLDQLLAKHDRIVAQLDERQLRRLTVAPPAQRAAADAKNAANFFGRHQLFGISYSMEALSNFHVSAFRRWK